MRNNKCIVICSGGLDSTTVAAHAKLVDKKEVSLLYFKYNCQAEISELRAVSRIAEQLKAELFIHDIEWLKIIGGSTLTNSNADIKTSIEGAEYPYEWVPARNLMFVAHAAALCDAKDISSIYMGLNLEESAVYPDNTIEFYEKMENILNVATLIRPKIIMPLARMMKWQIVDYAYRIGAPIELSWSCYKSNVLHCGCCGPCYMRKTAHNMLNINDSINYLT
jgi:7-cyano-7-deazaguanine synthase